ncbi:hypothetical protein [Zooshikella sp. RANM57]|uniref:hypothetical protein n=1 Tax=Zooshikella sp. RANM57 TaxID=3425863 RepID=UPI003D6FA199
MNKIKLFYAFATFILVLPITGCLKTTLIPQQNDTYSLIATDDTKDESLKGALEKAEDYCEDNGKRLVVLNYIMPSKNSDMAFKAKSAANTFLPLGIGFDTTEYRQVKLLFKCE